MKTQYRMARMLLLSRRLWRQRVVFWCGAVLVGIVASYFAIAVDGTQHLFDTYIRPHPWMTLFLSPVLFAGSAWVTQRYIPAARGSGIPQAIAARILRDDESRAYLLGPKVAVGKMLLTMVGLLGGASIGREGPTAQIGAAIMLACATFAGMRAQRGIVLAGAAAGVAAAFNTPLAGIVFAIEEMARAFEQRNSAILLIAIVLAGTAALSIRGNYDYFGYVNATMPLVDCWPAILVMGLLGGILGGVFSRILTDGAPALIQWLKQRRLFHPIVFAALCGLGIAIMGVATDGLTYGSGYRLGHGLLMAQLDPVWWHVPAKFIATTFSAISGIPGGFFAPSLSIGAALGADWASWFPSVPMQGVVLLAMVAYFTGVTQAPITAFVIVLEITGKASDAVPLIATAVIAAMVARVICPHSLYHRMAKGFIIERRMVTNPTVT